MYYLLQLVLIGWSVYAEIVHKLSQYHLVVIVFLALIVELLVTLNKKFDTAEVNYEEEENK
jgi:hypothetical protein